MCILRFFIPNKAVYEIEKRFNDEQSIAIPRKDEVVFINDIPYRVDDVYYDFNCGNNDYFVEVMLRDIEDDFFEGYDVSYKQEEKTKKDNSNELLSSLKELLTVLSKE